MQKKEIFYGRGKLLLSGEYLILDGAQGLCFPVNRGQKLEVCEAENSNRIHWTSYVDQQKWLDVTFDFQTLDIQKTNDLETSTRLQTILKKIKMMNKNAFDEAKDFTTFLEFPRQWGLGSSSTLIYCLGQWSNVDAHALLHETFGGSGYDISCASAKGPFVYQKNNQQFSLEAVNFKPSFSTNLYLVYLGQKSNTQEAIKVYNRSKGENLAPMLEAISKLTRKFVDAEKLEDFMSAMKEHEELMGQVLQTKVLKEKLFFDFNGEVKSLGAWGGDFALVASAENFPDIKSYFQQKGLAQVFNLFDFAVSNE